MGRPTAGCRPGSSGPVPATWTTPTTSTTSTRRWTGAAAANRRVRSAPTPRRSASRPDPSTPPKSPPAREFSDQKKKNRSHLILRYLFFFSMENVATDLSLAGLFGRDFGEFQVALELGQPLAQLSRPASGEEPDDFRRAEGAAHGGLDRLRSLSVNTAMPWNSIDRDAAPAVVDSVVRRRARMGALTRRMEAKRSTRERSPAASLDSDSWNSFICSSVSSLVSRYSSSSRSSLASRGFDQKQNVDPVDSSTHSMWFLIGYKRLGNWKEAWFVDWTRSRTSL